MRPWYSRWPGLLGVFFFVAGLLFLNRAFLFEPFRFPGTSMAPTIERDAYIVVNKWGYGNYEAWGIRVARTSGSAQVQRGDIIVFKYPEDTSLTYAKRVVGLPGDRVAYQDRRLSINDRQLALRRIGELRSAWVHYMEKLGDSEHGILLGTHAPPELPTLRRFPFHERCRAITQGVSCDVPPGHYFVLGDNRDNSSDSRAWGFVPAANVLGKVEYIFQ